MLLEPNATKWNLDEAERKEIISYLPSIESHYRILVRCQIVDDVFSVYFHKNIRLYDWVGPWSWNRTIYKVFRSCTLCISVKSLSSLT